MYHSPVLLTESVDALNIKPDGVYVDVTFGGGGHSKEILTRLGNGKLIAFDQDPEAKANALNDDRFVLMPYNFMHMKNWLTMLGHTHVDGILADLGVSSHQFDSHGRGFSIRFDATLDMRMDMQRELNAARVVNTYEEDKLLYVLRNYGEVDRAWHIVQNIVRARPVNTTAQLIEILKKYQRHGKEHKLAAQVFQALRIEVNGEMDALKQLLMQSVEVLAKGGRLSVISYHSLEDRLVKDFMKTGNFEGDPQKDFYGNLLRPLKPLHSKPIVPAAEEIQQNNRARSAKLRIAEKL
ncbi:MAG: 16S rRNA (cytosine(1402)-N(4))-methyltransferase RsmH [Flavobacteriales bacterium]